VTPATGAVRAAPAAAIFLMLATMAVFVATDSTAKYLVRTYPVLEVTWARFVFHLPVVLVLIAQQRRVSVLRTQRLGLQLGRAGCQLASTTLFFLAVAFLPLATAIAIGFVQPLLVTILSVPLLGEKVGPRRWAAVGVGFLGALVIVRPGPTMHWAVLLPLGMAFFSALYQVATRRVATLDNAAASLFYNAVAGALALSVAAPFVWQAPDAKGWVLLVLVGVGGGFGHLLLISAFARASASLLAPFTYTQLVWATVLGFLVFGDLPDQWTLLGAVIIVGSGLYVFARERAQARAAQASISTSKSGRTSAEMTTSVEAGRASPMIRSRAAR
jgi:drug/metabolite transporter (DMT)-like permease